MVFFAFVLGAISVVAAEVLGLYWILRRLGREKSGGSRIGIGNDDELGMREDSASDGSLCRGVEKQVKILSGVFLDCDLIVVLLTVRTGLFRVIFGFWSWSKGCCWNRKARRSSFRFFQSRSLPKSKRMISY